MNDNLHPRLLEFAAREAQVSEAVLAGITENDIGNGEWGGLVSEVDGRLILTEAGRSALAD